MNKGAVLESSERALETWPRSDVSVGLQREVRLSL